VEMEFDKSLKLEAPCSFEVSVSICKTTRRLSAEGQNVNEKFWGERGIEYGRREVKVRNSGKSE
jgi:hypothetical protein